MEVPCHMLEWSEVIFSEKKNLTCLKVTASFHWHVVSYQTPLFQNKTPILYFACIDTVCCAKSLKTFSHMSIEWVMNGAVLFIALKIRKQNSGPEASQLVELINSVKKLTLMSSSTINMAHIALDQHDLLETITRNLALPFWNLVLTSHF